MGLFKKKSKQKNINIEHDYTQTEKEFTFLSLILSRKKNITKEFLIGVYASQQSEKDYLKDDDIAKMREKVKFTSEIETIEENGATLSGGEKKKLFMLKWLMNPSCSLVVLDEIDAGLDDETKTILKELENELLEDKQKIVMKISHIDTDNTGYDQVIRLS